jgi:hypothetical protein
MQKSQTILSWCYDLYEIEIVTEYFSNYKPEEEILCTTIQMDQVQVSTWIIIPLIFFTLGL